MLFGYRVQTSIYGTPIPIVYGRQRVTGNIIQIFAWNPKPLGGKTAGKGAGGGKGGTRQYDYTSGVLIGLCAGPIYGILNVWNDKDQYRLALGTFQWDPADGLTVNISHPPATQAGGAPWPLPPIPGISSGSTGNSFWINNGCTRADTYSQDTNDYGSPGAGTISGTQQTLMQLVRENPQAGQYTLAAPNDVTYGFSPADADHVITVSFMYEIANTSTTLDPLTHLNLILFNGEQGQAPNPAISTYFPNYALGYSELAYVASDSMDLGSSGMFPNLSFEVYGKCQFGGPGGVSTIPYGGGGGSTVVDCCPADIINDLLSSQLYGPLRWSSADLADPSTSVGLGTAGEVYRYCAANSIFVSQVIDKQQTAASWIQDLLLIANSNCFWSEGVLKFRSYGDTSAVGNGFTYTPNTQPVFDLDDDDFNAKEGEEPVTINRSSARDAYNQVTIEWSNRANSYNLEPLIEQDSWSISQFGLRPDSPQSLHGICLQTVAQAVASTILKRKVYIRNTYTFKLGWQYAQLDPMDIVTLTDPYLGLNKLPVRITKIEEAEDGLEITAEDFPWSVSAPTLYGKQPVAAPGYFSDPGNVNPPIFFEPPAELTQNVQYQLWIAVSGSQSWGGCDIYEATSETGPYKYVGTLNGASTMGNTTASLPSHADPDTTDTLSVNVAECLGTLDSFTQAEADGFQSLILVDQELMAYETATLTSPYQYNISYLRRGVFNTAITAHNSGAPFAVIDPAQLFALTYTQADVGQTRWFKFASFNLFGSQKQDISTVAAYSVTLTPPPGAPSFDVEQSPIDPTVAEVTDVSFPASPANLSITDGTFSFYYVDPETPSVDLGTALAASTSGAADTLTLGGAPPSAWNLKVGDFLVVGQEIVQTTGAASGDSIPILRGMLGSAAVAEPLTNGSTPTLVSLVQPAITKTVSWPSGFFAADGSGDSTWSLSVSLPSMILVAVTGFGTNNFGDGDVVQFFLPDGGLLLENLGTRVVNIDNAATTILSPGQQIVNVLSTTTTCTIVLPLASGMQGQDITIALMNGSTGKYVLQTQTEPTGTGDLLMGSASSYTNSTPGTSVTVVAGMDPPAGSNVFDWIAVSTSGNVSAPPVPAAPNITGVTGLSASHVIVNGAPFYLFTGQIGLPTTDPNYAHLKNIEIQALNNATGASYWLSQGEIASASFGSLTSIPFKDQELPAASTTDTPSFTLTFWVKNDANALTPNPVTNTVTVDAGVIESIGVTDNTAARVLIQGPNVATVHLEITVTLDADHGPEPITIWIYAPDYANSYGGAWRYLSNPYQIGGSGATTTIQIDTGLYVPNSSEENWQAAIFLGDIANLAGGPPETSGPNVVTFTVNGYGPPLPTDLTGCSLGPLSYTLATNGFWEWNLPYTLNIPSGIADVNFWYGALWVEKGKWDGTTWTKDPNTPDGDFVASPVTITNTWTDYVPAANDPYPHFKVWAAVETHPNGTPWTVQTGAFPSSVYSQGGEFLSGSNATYCYIAPKQQATNKPLATDITGGAVAGDVGSWAQQTADGVQYLSIPGPTFNQAPRSSDPNFQYWIVTVTVVDGDNNVITPEKVFASNGYGASDAQSLWIGYANNQYVRWKVYAANANVTNPANFSDSANCTLQTGFASGADHIDSPLFPVPAGAILASRLAGQITQSQISSVSAASIVGSIAASQIGSVSASSITGQIVASQISTVSAAAIQGAISASQIGSVSASTITGLIAASQVGSVSASAITGQIVASQIASISASVISGVISGNATITAAQITGVLVSSQLEAEILDNVSLISGGIFGPGITISGSAIQQATDNTANMASNPGFEYQGKDWSTTGGITFQTAQHYSGSYAAAIAVTPATAQWLSQGWSQAGPQFTCKPGDEFVLQVYYYAPGCTGSAFCYCNFYSTAGTYIGGQFATMTPNSAWTVAQTPIATAPPNAAYVIIYAFYQPGTNSCSGTWYIDNVVFRPAVDASMVSSVNASSITGFITAGQISQVSASSIIGLILANQISSVSAASITGQLQASQIGHVSASSISGQIVASQISTVSAASIQGTINASNIGLIAASQISGQISANQIGTIDASQINIGAGAAGTIDVTNTLTFSGAGGIEFAGNGGINIGGAGGLSITGTGGVTIWNGDLSLTNGVLSAVETTVAYYYSFGGFYALTTPNLVTTLKIQNGYNGNYYGQIVFSNQIADDIIELYSGYTIGIRSGTLFFQSQNQFQFNTPGGPSTGSFLIGYTGELTSYNPSTVQGGYGSGGQNFYRTLYPGSYSGYTGFVDAGIAGVGYADFGANETGPRYFTMQFVNGLFVGFQ